MIKIDKPVFSVKEVFTACVDTVANINRKNNLSNCTDAIIEAELEFDNKFSRNEIYTIPQNNTVVAPVGTEEMKTVYNYRLVQTDEGSKYYNKIISKAPHGLCPICSVRIADTLDHFLPKAKYPIYSVTPLNLSPACTNCNKDKKIDYPTSSNDQLLSPYYDDIENISWLSAEMIQTTPISFNFFVQPPNIWDEVLKDRVINHFECYNLNILYASHACQELRGITKTLKRKRYISIEEVKFYLNESYNDRLELGLNSWQAVFYKTLLDDDWFCDEGINNI